MRILLVVEGIPPEYVSGSGRVAYESGRYLASIGHEVCLLTTTKSAQYAEHTPHPNFRICTVPHLPHAFAHYRSVFSRRGARVVLNTVKKWRPDIVHAHQLTFHFGYTWIQQVRRQGIPVLFTAHGCMFVDYGKAHSGVMPSMRALWIKYGLEFNPLRNVLIHRALREVPILSVSHALAEHIALYGYSSRVLHNGIDTTFWSPGCTAADARRQLGLPTDAFLFFLAGRIGHDKGSSAIAQYFPAQADLVVAGDFSEDLFAHLGKRAHFFPQQDQEKMRLLYSAIDVTIVPSVYLDPFPTVCLESMAMERPVIATCFGGAQESVLSHQTGWIVDPRLPVFGSLMQSIVRGECAVANLGSACRQHVLRHFSLQRHCEELVHHYQAECEVFSSA